jgi:hypothetical protein
MAATSAGGVQAAAVVQGRGVVVAEVGPILWLWQASGQAAVVSLWENITW